MMPIHCLVHSVGVALLIRLPRAGRLQPLGIITAVRKEKKKKEVQGNRKKREKAGQAATRFDEHFCLTVASPQNHSKRGVIEILLPGEVAKSAPSPAVPDLRRQ